MRAGRIQGGAAKYRRDGQHGNRNRSCVTHGRSAREDRFAIDLASCVPGADWAIELPDEQPSYCTADRAEEDRDGAGLPLLLELRVQLGQRGCVAQMFEPVLEAIDVTLYAGELALDREDIADRGGFAQQLAQLIALGGKALDPRRDVDRLLRDILRRDAPRSHHAEHRERIECDVELWLGNAERHVDGSIVARLTRDVTAKRSGEAVGAHERRREVLDDLRQIASPHEHPIGCRYSEEPAAHRRLLGHWSG